jgi:cellulose synthase/poly-beta-1,6-N-acetylglucosamine synthase-like glycosyltransferase
MFHTQNFLSMSLLFSALVFANSVALMIVSLIFEKKKYRYLLPVLTVVPTISIWIILNKVSGPLFYLAVPTGLLFSLLLLTNRFFKNYSFSGNLFISTNILLLVFGLTWSVWYIYTIPVSNTTRFLMIAGAPLIVFSLPSSVVQFIEQFEILLRKNWLRPRSSFAENNDNFYPKVYLHVPTYSEPPEVVKQTLDKLAEIDYPNFEVLVFDNNTKDELLWMPVEAHCKKLGNRFHFVHVDGVKGAKAGALNLALKMTPDDVEIIGVIDADYHSKSDFLKALVPYFKDPNIGFVQTPHDYRGWENSSYLRMCYWEYQIFFHTTMVALNEKDTALTVGTMCLIRKKALEEAGDWAEWCVTEDSELSIRIHALGYSSIYTTESFGKGLIPETFEGYKKQRFRWTAGPVQELKHHINLYVFWPWNKPSLLSFAQKLHHLNHGWNNFNIGLGLMLLPLGIAIIVSMLYHQEVVHVYYELWLTATVILISGFALKWLLYKKALDCSLKDMLGASIASKALSHIISIASFKTIFENDIPWNRTSKFKSLPLGLGAVSAAKTEFMIGAFLLTFAITSFYYLPKQGLLLMFLIGVVYKAIDYLMAPVISVVAEREIRKDQSRSVL